MAHRALLTAFACLTLTATLLPVPAFAQSAPGWSLPWKLNADAGSVDELVMAALPSGGTLAVWSATVAGPSSVLFYSEFVPASGWQAPAAIDSGGSYSHLALRLNSGGSGALVWSLYAGVQVTYGSFFQPGTGFSRAAALSNNSFVDSAPPTVAVDGAGLVTVLWPEQDGANLSEFAARGDASARTWGLAELVEHDNVGRAYGELGALAVDGNGTVHALWKHFNGTIGRVFTNTYTSGTGWGTETGLDNGSSTWHFNLHIAAFADGRAVALWTQEEWFTGALPLVTTFDPGRGWDAAPRLLLPQNATATDLVSFACGGPGTCIAAWSQNLGTHFGVVATSSVDRGDSFTTPHELDTSLLGNGHYSDAAVGPDGAGLLVWSQDSDPPAGADLLHAYASAFAPATGFGPTHRLDRVGTQSVDQVRASAGSQGFLAAAWMQKDATLDSGYASLFSAPDTTAPKLRVTAPLDGAVLTEPSVVVTGVTDPGSSVSVNGELALVRSNGSFALRIPLTVGQNQVRVTATDEAGNSAAVAVPVTVLDSTLALAGQLTQANQTIVWLLENQTLLAQGLGTKDGEIASLEANITVLQLSLSLTLLNQTILMANLGEMHGQLANATANATAAQADAAAAHASQNASAAALASASTHADAAQSNASSAFLTAVVSIALGAGAIGLSLVRRGGAQGSPKKSFAQRGGGGGGGGSGGSFGINEQGVKRGESSFGINEQGVKRGEVATGDLDGDGREAFARGPRQTTSLDDSFDRNLGLDSHQIQARQGESGLSVERQTPKADFGDRMKAGLETASGVTGEASAPPDVSSGMPTEKRQHGKNWVVDDTGDEGLTQRDQAPGMATGKRQHGPGPVIKAVDAEGIGSQGQDGGSRGPRQTTSLDGSYAPDAGRDAASGQATGKRQHGPGPVIKAVDDEGIGSQGQDGVSRDVKTPRDAASGQASGKMAAPRDSATGQASGKRVAGGDLDGDRFVDRDAASGQASGKRESATGQASGQRETATGKATGRTAAPGDPGSGSPSGLAIGDQGAVEGTPPKKKPPK